MRCESGWDGDRQARRSYLRSQQVSRSPPRAALDIFEDGIHPRFLVDMSLGSDRVIGDDKFEMLYDTDITT